MDFALKFSNEATFNYVTKMVFETLSGRQLEEGEPTPRQGLSLSGTHWFVDVIGNMYETTIVDDSDPENIITTQTLLPGFYANLRWNGGDDQPPSEFPGLEIVWSSDMETPLPAWWSRVIA